MNDSSTPSPGSMRDPLPPEANAVMVLTPVRGWRFLDLPQLWRYRELLFFLTWRDVKVRYKQTVLGAAWALIQPLATMVVLTLFVGRLSKIDNYPLFAFAGLLPWVFFSNAIGSASQSIVGSQNLVTKVYFPRLIIPMSSVAANLVDFVVAFGLLILMLLRYAVTPTWQLIALPVICLGLVVAALGVGMFLSALTVAYRDFRYVVPFMVQLWMFATPSVYLPTAEVGGGRYTFLLPLNPAYGLILNFRAAVLGTPFDYYTFSISFLVGVLGLILGCLYFRRVERSFADII